MKKAFFSLLVLSVLVAVVYLNREALRDAAIVHQGKRVVGEDLKRAWLRDGKLHVVMVGTGQPRADAGRAQASVAVIAGGEFLLFDAGAGSSIAAESQSLPMDALKAVFLTHFHSDHIADLPMMSNLGWRMGRTVPLRVIGPRGTIGIVGGFNRAFTPDATYRASNAAGNPAAAFMKGSDVDAPPAGARVEVYRSKSGLVVYAFSVDHSPVEPAFGYRVEFRGRSVVISGDTRKSRSLAKNARGADILIHEAYNKEIVKRFIRLTEPAARKTENHALRSVHKTARRVMHYHASPGDAADVAREAGVGKLVFYHIIPPLGSPLARLFVTESLFLKGVKDVYGGPVVIAEDGDHYQLAPK